MVEELEFRAQGLGFRVQMVEESLRVQDLGVYGLQGFETLSPKPGGSTYLDSTSLVDLL